MFHVFLYVFLYSPSSLIISTYGTDGTSAQRYVVLPVSFPVDLLLPQQYIHWKGSWQNAPLCSVGIFLHHRKMIFFINIIALSGLNMDYLDKEIFGKIGIIGFKKHIKIKQLNHVKLFETKNRILVRVQRVPPPYADFGT